MKRRLLAWTTDYRRALKRREAATQRAIAECRPLYAQAMQPTTSGWPRTQTNSPTHEATR
jgi:hypothetical protein